MLSKHLHWCFRESQAAGRENFGKVGMEQNPNVPQTGYVGEMRGEPGHFLIEEVVRTDLRWLMDAPG